MTTQVRDLPRQYRELGKLALAANWTIEPPRRGGHWKWKSPRGQLVVIAGTINGGKRSFENSVASLRRAGLEVPR